MIGYEEDHVSVELIGRQEEWEEDVGKCVEVVVGVCSAGEDDGRNVAEIPATIRDFIRCVHFDGELGDAFHDCNQSLGVGFYGPIFLLI